MNPILSPPLTKPAEKLKGTVYESWSFQQFHRADKHIFAHKHTKSQCQRAHKKNGKTEKTSFRAWR